jgi:hypothetical protein
MELLSAVYYAALGCISDGIVNTFGCIPYRLGALFTQQKFPGVVKTSIDGCLGYLFFNRVCGEEYS